MENLLPAIIFGIFYIAFFVCVLSGIFNWGTYSRITDKKKVGDLAFDDRDSPIVRILYVIFGSFFCILTMHFTFHKLFTFPQFHYGYAAAAYLLKAVLIILIILWWRKRKVI